MTPAAPSQAAIGRALGLSPAAVTKLKGQGMPVESVQAAQAWRVARQNVAARKPVPAAVQLQMQQAPPTVAPRVAAPDESHDAARTRREIAEADLAELKLAELNGELVRADQVRASLAKRAAAFREGLLQIPSRLSAQLAAETNQAAVHALLDAELRTVMAQLTAEA